MEIQPDIVAEAKRRQGTRNDLATSVSDETEVEDSTRTVDEIAEKVGLGSGRLPQWCIILWDMTPAPDRLSSLA